MNSTSKRHKGCDINNGIDRLTQLPDDILVRILSFLPILDAVRTVSIRRFGSLWTLLPSLRFHESEVVKKVNWPTRKFFYDKCTPRFTNFVRNVLFLNKRMSLDKFELCLESIMMDDDDYTSEEEVTAWIRFAVNRQVKGLYIGSADDEIYYDLILPRCVFKSQFLVQLKLDHIQINELSHEVQMGSLRILSLYVVEATNKVVEKIILGCPSLQELALDGVVGLDELLLNAPTIKKLKLAEYNGLIDCPNLQVLEIEEPYAYDTPPVQVVGVSSIHEVNIYGYHNLNTFEEYLMKFSKVNVFKYSDVELESSELKVLDPPQTRWKRLHIQTLLDGDRLFGICNVLRSSPNLEELILYNNSHSRSATMGGTNDHFRELPPCLMLQLKTVTMHPSNVCSHSLLQLAKVLLKGSVNLEKMVILPSKKKSAAVDEVKFLKDY